MLGFQQHDNKADPAIQKIFKLGGLRSEPAIVHPVMKYSPRLASK